MTKKSDPFDGIADGGQVWSRAFAAAIRPPGPRDAEIERLRAELDRVTAERDAAVGRQLELLRELSWSYSMIELLATDAADGEH